MANERPSTRLSLMRWSPALLGVGALLMVVAVLAFPPAQAAAQGFLDLFRVRRFSAITVDPARLQQIQNTNIDFESIISNNVKRIKDPGKPQTAANAAAAGFPLWRVVAPGWLRLRPALQQ